MEKQYVSKFEMHGDRVRFDSIEEFARAICKAFSESYDASMPGKVKLADECENTSCSEQNEWISDLYDYADDENLVYWSDFVEHCENALDEVDRQFRIKNESGQYLVNLSRDVWGPIQAAEIFDEDDLSTLDVNDEICPGNHYDNGENDGRWDIGWGDEDGRSFASVEKV